MNYEDEEVYESSPVFLSETKHIYTGIDLDVTLDMGKPAGDSTMTQITFTPKGGMFIANERRFTELSLRIRGDWERAALVEALKWVVERIESKNG